MAMTMAQQFGASLTGNIEQARLIIYDFRDTVGALDSDFSSMINNIKNMDPAEKLDCKRKIKNDCVLKMSDFRKKATDFENGSNENDIHSKTKTFLLHFNPSQLQLSTVNPPTRIPDATGKEPANDSVTKAKMILNVKLYFDEMNTYDSFMASKLTAGVTAEGVKNIAASIAKANGKVWSVQDEVEGLIAALCNPYTRNVSFRWADFAFTGQLENISAKYTMFSTSGRPVRAQMDLRIRHEMDDVYLKSWYDSYKEAFEGDSSRLSNASQTVGNIINFEL